jgi:hypothetical protein
MNECHGQRASGNGQRATGNGNGNGTINQIMMMERHGGLELQQYFPCKNKQAGDDD